MNVTKPASRQICAAEASLIILLTALIGVSASAVASTMQRMVMAPGCFVLSPRGFEDVSAYCLDQAREPPRWGAILSNVSTSLDHAVIKSADGSPVTLSQALAQRAVQIEGLGNRMQLRVRNLSDKTVEICIDGPTVVMGNGETDTSDLDKVRDEIGRLIAAGHSRSTGAESDNEGANGNGHAAIQQKLWNAVNKVDREGDVQLTPDIFFGPLLSPSAKEPASTVPRRARCVGRIDSVEVCLE
jgi:hypothetical protein